MHYHNVFRVRIDDSYIFQIIIKKVIIATAHNQKS